MELKFKESNGRKFVSMSSNRTFMELKFAYNRSRQLTQEF